MPSVKYWMTVNRQIFDSFEQLRPKNNEDIEKIIRELTQEVFSQNHGQYFSLLIKQLNKAYEFNLSEQDITAALREFNYLFHYKPEEFDQFDQIVISGNEARKTRLVAQFTKFYLTEIFGKEGYKFIGKYLSKRFLEDVDKFGQTYLHQWARNGRYGWILFLLQLASGLTGQLGTQREAVPYTVEDLLEVRDINGRTPLHLAVYSGNEDSVKALLEHKGSSKIINVKDKVGYTPLHWAAYYGHAEIAAQLLQHNADLNGKRYDKLTPLHLAAWKGHEETIKLLIARGTNINAVTMNSFSPLHYAVMGRSLAGLDTLLIADNIAVNIPSDEGLTALHCAAWFNKKDAIRKLIDKRANVEQTTIAGYTAGDLLAYRHSEKIPDLPKTSVGIDCLNPPEFFTLIAPFPPLTEMKEGMSEPPDYSPLHAAVREGDEKKCENPVERAVFLYPFW